MTYFMVHMCYAYLAPPIVVGVLLTCQSPDQGSASKFGIGPKTNFSPSLCSVLPIHFLVTMVPAALRSLTRSSRVVLG